MLESIRKFAASPFGKAVFILILVAFGSGFWYFGNPFATGDDTSWVLRVGDRIVSPETVRSNYQRQLSQLRAQAGGRLDAEQAKAMGLPNLVVTRLMNQALLDEAATGLHLWASDDLVRAAILSNPAFQGATGSFNRDIYAQTLRLSGFTERHFEALMRRELERNQLVSSLSAPIVVPQPILASLYRIRNEQRIAEVVRISDSAISDVRSPGEDELRTYYEEHAERFTAPEYRAITAIVLQIADLTDEMVVSEQEILNDYEDRRDEFQVPESRHLQQVVLSTEEAANAALTKVRNGSDFAAVAGEETGSVEAIDIGTVTKEQLLPELADAAFSVKEGEVAGPARSPLGWHLIKVIEITPARERTLEDVRPQIRQELARQKALEAIYGVSNRLQDALGGGATLEEAASQLGLRLLRVPAVSAEGEDKAGNAVPDLPDELVTTAFSLAQGEESLLVELGTEGYYVVRVDDIVPPTVRPFEAVRREVIRAVAADRKADATEARASALAEAAGADLIEQALEEGFEVITTNPFDRSSLGEQDIPKQLMDALFRAEQGAPVVVRGQDASYVGRVTKIITADPVTASGELDALSVDLQQAFGSDLVTQYLDALRQRFPVAVNARVMDRLF